MWPFLINTPASKSVSVTKWNIGSFTTSFPMLSLMPGALEDEGNPVERLDVSSAAFIIGPITILLVYLCLSAHPAPMLATYESSALTHNVPFVVPSVPVLCTGDSDQTRL